MRDETNKVVVDFKEFKFLLLKYNANFNIFEALIRKGLIEGSVEITNN